MIKNLILTIAVRQFSFGAILMYYIIKKFAIFAAAFYDIFSRQPNNAK